MSGLPPTESGQNKRQLELFPVASGVPRKDFDEGKHVRETYDKPLGKFVYKYARIESKEVQLILPGMGIPAQRRIIKRRHVPGQGPARLDDDKE